MKIIIIIGILAMIPFYSSGSSTLNKPLKPWDPQRATQDKLMGLSAEQFCEWSNIAKVDSSGRLTSCEVGLLMKNYAVESHLKAESTKLGKIKKINGYDGLWCDPQREVVVVTEVTAAQLDSLRFSSEIFRFLSPELFTERPFKGPLGFNGSWSRRSEDRLEGYASAKNFCNLGNRLRKQPETNTACQVEIAFTHRHWQEILRERPELFGSYKIAAELGEWCDPDRLLIISAMLTLDQIESLRFDRRVFSWWPADGADMSGMGAFTVKN